MLRSPEIIVATWRAARRDLPDLTEAEVRDALDRFDQLWDELKVSQETTTDGLVAGLQCTGILNQLARRGQIPASW
jgi:hypothetical protein